MSRPNGSWSPPPVEAEGGGGGSRVAAAAILLGATALGASAHYAYRRFRYGRALRASEGLRCFALRLNPGEELKSALMAKVRAEKLRATCVLTCVGSLRKATLRMANASKAPRATAGSDNEVVTRNERFEIVSLVGTFAEDGRCHLHASLSDKNGQLWGGHVVGDMEVFTTAEIVLAECSGLVFAREHDPMTGYDELAVHERGARPRPGSLA